MTLFCASLLYSIQVKQYRSSMYLMPVHSSCLQLVLKFSELIEAGLPGGGRRDE